MLLTLPWGSGTQRARSQRCAYMAHAGLQGGTRASTARRAHLCEQREGQRRLFQETSKLSLKNEQATVKSWGRGCFQTEGTASLVPEGERGPLEVEGSQCIQTDWVSGRRGKPVRRGFPDDEAGLTLMTTAGTWNLKLSVFSLKKGGNLKQCQGKLQPKGY